MYFIVNEEFIMSVKGTMFFVGLVFVMSAVGSESLMTIALGSFFGLALMTPYALQSSKEL